MGWPYLRAWIRSRYVASVALPGSCFTWDLIALANWLKSRGIETVAMQSTGVYWIPLYDILEEHGIRVFLVNARDTKNMPGRQSDIQECRWWLKLQVYGLLKNSFRPAEEIRIMRTFWRQRQPHIGDASRCVQHMQKALTKMNLQLLAKLGDPRIKASEEVGARSLEGNWREELLFVLKQESESFQTFQKKIAECE